MGEVDDTVLRRDASVRVVAEAGPTAVGPDEDTVRVPRPGVVARTPHRPAPASDGSPIAQTPPDGARVPAIRIGDRVVRLDRPVRIGRRPTPARVTTGRGAELVTVPSRHGLVSATHIVVRAEGGVVVVEDLRSTNGTSVRVPGSPPVRMPSGAAMVVLTGTVVDIGDGNTVEILSRHLRVAPPAGHDPAGTDLTIPPIPRHHD